MENIYVARLNMIKKKIRGLQQRVKKFPVLVKLFPSLYCRRAVLYVEVSGVTGAQPMRGWFKNCITPRNIARGFSRLEKSNSYNIFFL